MTQVLLNSGSTTFKWLLIAIRKVLGWACAQAGVASASSANRKLAARS